VTATNASYNGALPAGGSATIGYQASHTGNAGAPTGFKLNGTTCS
jgi:endoglucanase